MAVSIGGKIAVGFTALIVGAGAGAYASGALDDVIAAENEQLEVRLGQTAAASPAVVARPSSEPST